MYILNATAHDGRVIHIPVPNIVQWYKVVGPSPHGENTCIELTNNRYAFVMETDEDILKLMEEV